MSSKITPSLVTAYSLSLNQSLGIKLLKDGILQELFILASIPNVKSFTSFNEKLNLGLSLQTKRIMTILMQNKRLAMLPLLCQRLIGLLEDCYGQKILIIESSDIATAEQIYKNDISTKPLFIGYYVIYQTSNKQNVLKLRFDGKVLDYSLDNQIKLIKQKVMQGL